MAVNADKIIPLIRNGQDAQDLAVNILLPFHEGFLYGLRYLLVGVLTIAVTWTVIKYLTDPYRASVFRLVLVVAFSVLLFHPTNVDPYSIAKDSENYEEKVEGYELLAEDFIFNHLKTSDTYQVSWVMWTFKTVIDAVESILYNTFDYIVENLGGGDGDVPFELYSGVSMNAANVINDDNMRKIYLHHHMCGNLLVKQLRESGDEINMPALRAMGYNSGMLGLIDYSYMEPPVQNIYIKNSEMGGVLSLEYFDRVVESKSKLRDYIQRSKNICPLNSGECLANWPHQNSYIYFKIPTARYWYDKLAASEGEPTFSHSLFGLIKDDRVALQDKIKSIEVSYYPNATPQLMPNSNISEAGYPETGIGAPANVPAYPTGPSLDVDPIDRFYPQTCYDTFTLANMYWREFRIAASLFYDIPIKKVTHIDLDGGSPLMQESRTVLTLGILNQYAQNQSSEFRADLLGKWTGVPLDESIRLDKAADYSVGFLLEGWIMFKEMGIKYLVIFVISSIALLIGLMVVGFPIVALMSAFPGRIGVMKNYLLAFIFLKFWLFLDYFFLKLGTLLGGVLRNFLADSSDHGFEFLSTVALLNYGVDIGVVLMISMGAPMVSYFLIFSESHGLRGLSFSSFGARQAGSTAGMAVAAMGTLGVASKSLRAVGSKGASQAGGSSTSTGGGNSPPSPATIRQLSRNQSSGQNTNTSQETLKTVSDSLKSSTTKSTTPSQNTPSPTGSRGNLPRPHHPGNDDEPFKKT